MEDENRITISVSVEQARAMSRALDVFARLSLGQLREIDMMVRFGDIYSQKETPDYDAILSYVERIGECLGYSPNGQIGIWHPSAPIQGKRAWEIKKTIDRVIAGIDIKNTSDPEIKMHISRTINYDGLNLRFTDDPAPIATVGASNHEAGSVLNQSESPADQSPGN